MRSQPLKVELSPEGLLSISIGVEALKLATELCPRLEDGNDCEGPTVVDADIWAKEVRLGLLSEQEDGTTPVHLMFDSVFERCAEEGAEGIRMAWENNDD